MTIPHASFTIERHYAAPRARVFHAWSDPAQMAKWYVPTGQLTDSANDFRVGGRQMHAFGHEGGPSFRFEGRYEDIVEGERIVTTGTMHMNDARGSTAICSVELFDDGEGTRIVMRDQSAYYMGDYSTVRKEGWSRILDNLDAYLKGQH